MKVIQCFCGWAILKKHDLFVGTVDDLALHMATHHDLRRCPCDEMTNTLPLFTMRRDWLRHFEAIAAKVEPGNDIEAAIQDHLQFHCFASAGRKT